MNPYPRQDHPRPAFSILEPLTIRGFTSLKPFAISRRLIHVPLASGGIP